MWDRVLEGEGNGKGKEIARYIRGDGYVYCGPYRVVLASMNSVGVLGERYIYSVAWVI